MASDLKSENQYREYRLLLLEDNNDDAELIEYELKKEQPPLKIKHVTDKERFLKELQDFAPDIIVSDYRIPEFDGLSALQEAKTRYPDVPFIIVSGAIGDDLAVETIKRGADDYVLKHRLMYLLPSIKKSIDHAELKRIKNELEKRTKELEIKSMQTEIKKLNINLEEEKIKRLSSIGEMASKLVHDVRNPLSILKNTTDMLKIKYSSNTLDSVSFDANCTRLNTAIASISNQIDSVLDFVRIAPLDLSEVSLLPFVRDVAERTYNPKNVKIEIPKDNYRIIADDKKLEIVLINLLVNAIDAIGDKLGEITIGFIKTNENVTIEIHDTGSGMPENIKTKIFEPLFTTKKKGTGLGLSTCKNIIEQHGGKISVESEINKGTTMSVILPIRANSEQSVK